MTSERTMQDCSEGMRMQIAPVTDNQDKYLTYRQWCGRYAKAMREGFYFEAMLIDYALMEDALRSYLYHIGVLAERDAKRACRKARPLRQLIRMCLPGEDDRLVIGTISGKMRIVRATLLWHADPEGVAGGDAYLLALDRQYTERIDTAGFLDLLGRIDIWRLYRNEVIHGLMNKNLTALDERIVEECEEGMALARGLQTQVKHVKYGNRIRRSMKLPVR